MDPHPVEKSAATPRIGSMDVVRGLVMVLMAIDHVRVYSGQPAGGPTAGIFFTRWITHFVAPGFVFFAGTGAFLHGAKLGDRGKLARFLASRGLWLVLLELTILRLAWTFNFDYAHYSLAGVIWMLGWCMVLMAGIIYLPMRAIATLGIAIIAFHPILYPAMGAVHAAEGSVLDALFKVLYLGDGFSLYGKGGPPLLVLFVIIPWIGVMAAGYAFGPVMRWLAERRRAFCLRLGIGAMVLFVALRALDAFGDPRHWHDMMAKGWPGLLAFLNTSKYPASLLFLLMTLGPMIALLPLVEGAQGLVGASARDLRSRAAVLLHSAHPADSPRRDRCVVDSDGRGDSVVVRESSAQPRASAGRISVEPAAALSRLGGRRGDPVLPVPLVRGAEGAAQERVAFILVTAS